MEVLLGLARADGPIPSRLFLSLAVLYRPSKQPTPPPLPPQPLHACKRAAVVATVECHYYGPGVVAAADPGVVTPRRLAPTCPAAPSPGLDAPAASTCQWLLA